MGAPRTLHVAAMPFPTRQGTQAAVRAMLDVLAGIGRETHLLAYARGEAGPSTAPVFRLHRPPDLPGRERFRSGPSLRKLAQDAQLASSLRRLARELAPDRIVAHHVEAAAACIAARVRPWIFVAHTDLAPELPTYGPPALAGLLRRAGARLDASVAARADAVAAISPALAATLADRSGRDVRYLPLPWPVPPPASDDEGRAARASLDLPADASLLLYAGNLDAYQGWEQVLGALALAAARRPSLALLVATASDPAPVDAAARAAGLRDRVHVRPLGDEPDRRRLHAAADVAVVPRRAPGGLPIKLLDALARGVPTVCTARAAAGLDLRGAALVAADDEPEALANGVLLALASPGAARELGARGRAYVATDHAPVRFVDALDAISTPPPR